MLLYYSEKRFASILMTLLVVLLAEASVAQEFSGYLRNYNAVVTTGDNEYLVGRNRFLFDIGIDQDFGSIFISNEVLNTYTISSNNYTYDFIEAYIDLFFTNSDLRIGKQIISQGRTEANFITDIISPIDISEFLTLQVEDLRNGIPAVKYTHYYGSNFLEIVASPIFESNIQARPGSRWFPFTEIEKQTNVVYADSLQENSFNSFQGMIKWGFRENLKWDLDIMAMLWAPGNPSYEKGLTLVPGVPPQTALQLGKTYLRSPILAYSGNYILSDNLIIKSESAFYFNKHVDYLPEEFINSDLNNLTPLQQQALLAAFDQNEDGFLKEKPWLTSMIGLKTSFGDLSVSTEFIFERIFEYENDLLQKENFYFSTLSLQKSMMRNKLNLRLFGRYNYEGSDYWVNPEASYDVRDGLIASFGFHLFGGKESEAFYGHFNFKNYASSSFGFVTLTAFF